MFNSRLKFIFCLIALSSVFLTLTNTVSAAGDTHLFVKPNNTVTPTSISDEGKLSTPELIERDFAKGKINNEERLLYLNYALYDYQNLPPKYHSNVLWDGTMIAIKLDYEEHHRPLNESMRLLQAQALQSLSPRHIQWHWACQSKRAGQR